MHSNRHKIKEDKKYFIRKDVATDKKDLFSEGIKNDKNTPYPKVMKSASLNSYTSSNASSITEDSMGSTGKYKSFTRDDDDLICSELERNPKSEKYNSSKQNNSQNLNSFNSARDKTNSKLHPGKKFKFKFYLFN